MNNGQQAESSTARQSWQARLRQSWPTALIVLFFAALSFVYFSPAVLDGRDLFQNDVAGASGIAQDVRDHYEATGETSYWTNSLFGGMPMYQIAPSYPSLRVLKAIQDFCTLQWPFAMLPSYSWLLFAMLVGFYIFMRSLRVERGYALLGALMWAFSSYFIILIEAGHIWKLMVLSFIPPTIAGIIYSYEGRYLRGGVITALFASLQLMSNHVQMSYYFAFVIVAIVLGYLYQAIRRQEYRRFMLASVATLVAAVISISINGSNIYHTYQYTQETMRGGSALATTGTGAEASKGGGLDKEYITAWSYGKAETFTFLVPNLYGGATGALGNSPEVLDKVKDEEAKQVVAGMNHYWGDQPFTSGPVYVGAFVLFLAVLALFIVRTPLKWALLGVTILSLFLGWGHNFMWFSDLFIDYFPMYNKFRTVSSILVIAEFTIPTLAILALVEFIQRPREVLQRERLGLGVSLASTLGVAFLIALVPGMFFDFMSDQETEMFRQYLSDPRAIQIIATLKDVRSGIVSADAWRSVAVLVVSLGLCYAYAKELLSQKLVVALLTVVTLLDLWTVDKRYLNDDKFIDLATIQAQATPVSDVDLRIKKDKDLHYRVLNLSVSPFNDATTSYSHRSIGGYHAAKLSRYQDVIEHQIAEQNQQVLDMLDMRYIITRDPHGQLMSQYNGGAMGAAWFVDLDKVVAVSTAQEEMNALKQLNLRKQAVVNKDQNIAGATGQPMPVEATDSLSIEDQPEQSRGSVRLTEYKPNRAKYEVAAEREALLVFSEIYYPHGWKLLVDGKPVELKRANYLLRAAVIPAGKHQLEMTFDPESVHTTELISYIAQALLLLGVLLLGYTYIRKQKSNI
ncbi:MAG: YfhO family protein [Porphyromonas sp.]|nr:YfhO family protein [Porphyromonas sp.]